MIGTPPRHRAAVLGSPVGHSLSPALHRAAYDELGLTDWAYGSAEVDEAALADFLDGLDASWVGLSLTMPLKRAVIPLLDELDPVARATGVVNTVTWTPGPLDGAPEEADAVPRRRRLGWNTDVEGLVAALRPSLQQPAGLTGGVLGGGATAVSAVAALAELGCAEVLVAARTPSRAAAVVETGERLGTSVRLLPWTDAGRCLACDVVVSTVPAGGTDELAAGIGAGDSARPASGAVLLDVVYDPWPTPLVRAWGERAVVVDGSEMLVHQAVAQVRLMTGREPSAEALRVAGVAEREARGAGSPR